VCERRVLLRCFRLESLEKPLGTGSNRRSARQSQAFSRLWRRGPLTTGVALLDRQSPVTQWTKAPAGNASAAVAGVCTQPDKETKR
jgi:hypothetical protein